jgi:serine/threonine protein kinase
VFDYIAACSQKNRNPGSDLATRFATSGLVERLGSGSFGSTFVYTPDGLSPKRHFVIKMNKAISGNRPDDSKPGWYRECHHTQQLKHENIIKYFGKPILYGDVYHCIMEYGGRSLESIYIDSGRRMDTKNIISTSLQVSAALHYLHTRDPIVIHRDIRSPNVTCNDDGVCKLIDFGLSSEKKLEETSKIKSDTDWGNHLWKSPEFCWHITNRGPAAGNIFIKSLQMIL